ncbi:MAG: PAS domain-containing protein, partial [Candidatus Ratteibacteria bacterium]
MQRELMIGPYAYLKEEIKKTKRKALILYIFLSIIGGCITGIILYLYYKQNRYKKELEESANILEENLQIKSETLSITTQKLSEEMKKLEKIIATLDIGIALVDKKGIILKVNQAFEDILNYKKSLLFKNVIDFFKQINPFFPNNTSIDLEKENYNLLAKLITNSHEK